MAGRPVWVERIRIIGLAAKAAKADHWAVWVGDGPDDCYEVSQDEKKMTITITKKAATQGRVVKGTLTFAGPTFKTDEEIVAENERWEDKHRKYNVLGANCQKHARDLIQFLVGDSYEPPCPLPQAGSATWFCKTASHTANSNGVSSSKWTAGRIGGIWTIFGAEVEGPKIARETSAASFYGITGSYMEASLFRVEACVYGLRARIQPNLNTCLGYRDGQINAKLAGFGVAFGWNCGWGISTPLGGVGIGRF